MWKKSDCENQFFKKITENKWVELQNGKIYADFEEIDYDNNVALLKKNDGTVVKLTERYAFIVANDSEYQFCEGFWSNDIPNQVKNNFLQINLLKYFKVACIPKLY